MKIVPLACVMNLVIATCASDYASDLYKSFRSYSVWNNRDVGIVCPGEIKLETEAEKIAFHSTLSIAASVWSNPVFNDRIIARISQLPERHSVTTIASDESDDSEISIGTAEEDVSGRVSSGELCADREGKNVSVSVSKKANVKDFLKQYGVAYACGISYKANKHCVLFENYRKNNALLEPKRVEQYAQLSHHSYANRLVIPIAVFGHCPGWMSIKILSMRQSLILIEYCQFSVFHSSLCRAWVKRSDIFVFDTSIVPHLGKDLSQ